MAKELATTEFEPSANVIELPIAPRRDAAIEAAAPAIEVRAKSAREIGTEFGVSDRAIQNAIKTVFAAYPWLDLKQLKIGSSNKTRYTPLCQNLLSQFRASDLSAEDWINSVWNAHPEEFARYSQGSTQATDTPLSQTEVLPRLDAPPADATGNRSSGVVPYERSTALTQLMNGRLAPKVPQSPEQNTVFLQVQEKLNRLQQQREHTRSQIQHTAQSHSDTAEALEVLEDIELIERVRAKAQRHFQLEQDIYREELDLLKTQTVLGK